MSGVGSDNAGRAWVLADVAEDSSMSRAVAAIAKLNREKDPSGKGLDKGKRPDWYIVRADELRDDDGGGLMIVVDADKPETLVKVVHRLDGLKELTIRQQFRVKIELLPDGKYKTFHHPRDPHQGYWDEVELPSESGSSSPKDASHGSPKEPAGPPTNPLNPWG